MGSENPRKTLACAAQTLPEFRQTESGRTPYGAHCGKKMRYAADAFIPLYGKRGARFINSLATLQNSLGSANDAHVGALMMHALITEMLKPQTRKPDAALAFDLGRIAGTLETEVGRRAHLSGTIWRSRDCYGGHRIEPSSIDLPTGWISIRQRQTCQYNLARKPNQRRCVAQHMRCAAISGTSDRTDSNHQNSNPGKNTCTHCFDTKQLH